MGNSAKWAVYLTDHWTLQDSLNFSDFRPALLEILRSAETPLTVGIFGPWGSGKTSLLRMLKAGIDAQGLPSLCTVWFTAWKYDRHEVLWRAFILRVLDALYPRESGEGSREERERIPTEKLDERQKKQVKHLDLLTQSLYGTVEWEDVGRWVLEWNKTGKELAKLPAFLLLLSVGAGKVAEMVGMDPNLADLVKQEIQTHRMSHVASMEQFEVTFKEALELALGKEGRLIVFVDDLDRCLPEKAVEVLEAIKLFLEVPGVIFVLGMDQEVIKLGVETRYRAFFWQQEERDVTREKPPIDGDVFLQKIVQIPFHLPPLATQDVEQYILALEKALPVDTGMTAMTRGVLAHGLFPNPRQVKRALNIFYLLRAITMEREKRPEQEGGLRPEKIAWPLLAKTVLIQTQWPELYRDWRQYPTLVQTLEGEYARQPTTEEEAVRGRIIFASTENDETAVPAGGLLAPYVSDQHRYALLRRMLGHPSSKETGEGRERARFEGLTRAEMAVYVRLAGAVEPKEPSIEVPGDLLTEMFSGDKARVQDAIAHLEELEPEMDGPQHQALQEPLLQAMRNAARPTQERARVGNVLSLVADPRFRPDASFLPNEPLLGFVEIPEGPFLMGSDSEQDPHATDSEIPLHEITLRTYYIARYPVTLAQYQAFVKGSNQRLRDVYGQSEYRNHPVVSVTWHDALAYCKWLTKRLREWKDTPEPLRTLLRHGADGDRLYTVTLPSEVEWEKAARGGLQIPAQPTVDRIPARDLEATRVSALRENPYPRRCYPWGDEPDLDRANSAGTGIGTTTAVGCFPSGVSPYGVEDLSGNVWEWTRSLWGQVVSRPDFGYPYKLEDGREDLNASGDVFRALRGGAFGSGEKGIRCSSRGAADPSGKYGHIGFRVVISAFP
jgi:formylglycine-generating enzyme required for sulfatase activity